MEPSIQYAQTKDGVNIAFWTLGEGTPFVLMPASPLNPSLLVREEARQWYERLAEKRMIVRYDNRGFGNSQRDVSDFSLDALVLDLEAVIDRLELEKTILFGYYNSGPVAVAYAAHNPDRVSHLLLWCTTARGADFYRLARSKALLELADKDWEFYTETVAHAALGWSAGERARQFAAQLRETLSPDGIRAVTDAVIQMDVADLLPQVKAPTLVLHRRELQVPEIDGVRGLAARIPDARLVLLEGDSIAPYFGDMEAVVRAIDEFLTESDPAPAPTPAAAGLVTILFTDMESSTALRQRLGDAQAQELVRIHNTIVRDALNANGGGEVKHTGDGIMASFPSASGALECSIAIQRGVATHVEEHPDAALRVYIGLNAGEPIVEERDLFGTSVDLAKRVCDRAEPGQILVSLVVRELAAGKDFLFADLGETTLRGFEDPVRLYELRWREDG
jgi:class 3 adenylate cyclase